MLKPLEDGTNQESSKAPHILINNYRVYDEEQVALLIQNLQLNLYQESAPQHSDNRGTPFFNTSLGNLYQGDSLKLLKGTSKNPF